MAASSSGQPHLHTLYAEHHDWLQAWLRNKLGCLFTAQDLAQDTFLRLVVRPRELDAGQNPRAYLTTIAKGLVVDHWRRAEIERVWVAAMLERPEATQPSAEYQAIVLETLVEVDRILATLADKPRQAFLLAQLHELTYAEIGMRLGVSERMVKKYMAQAMLHCLSAGADFRAALA
ncbi:sigma-70 family RNA polymerase sigma factor [Janthinobacterium psychrotolerans]|uniref:RNA polymerase sigma-70 factor, ECF subfamily n=1 Tax=Janthinobacterium psychrotolerans TaxID=1747903 RepID=A0A1A7C645_9BURK|nr:sigma-70 family RNA polymerase sigma factor [Janthinobacterium psychrotolerans]OBV39788.1 RNA polymerase sigma-70 factor, ECF subfamily [Janthinobacterium psychrotolerans]